MIITTFQKRKVIVVGGRMKKNNMKIDEEVLR